MRIAVRISRLEFKVPNGTLGPFTDDEMKSVDDLTLCRYVIQEAERAIADDADCDVFGSDTRRYYGVATDQELLAVLKGWRAEMEEP